ncbi:type II toxin-antitoxin system HicB family antitoxin [Oxalobacteraceae bacterium OTU3CINTB1]|nr:type II toxin-antitoxin system HicB family antitoxin [Oxalobacteraceae bacterium OTU3CINTB1]
MKYPATFAPETGGFVVTFRDIPEALTQGDTEQEALDMARDALITAMDFYFEDRRPVPAPSKPKPGERLITLPTGLCAKVLLLNEMLAQKVIPAELARRMGVKPQEVTRILDLSHSTKIDTVAAALSALGRELVLSVA